ncbi:alpha-L-fucosidase [Paenibacillus radicis (ex Xue et al. 2023)]|uniref:alpha-L-fucosidase n=1 Tax=Paenibacillus radicis (ex Xue et al. 2023) TaxID=2972489 RepID=A0ABT1YHT3_9BACL|nr:alpha-L-fucosidase [Paenibacillus radicis (ex Xue et al. 2023)]MCR8632747.1 alpha-L-fucosidase [Paenibacillus radicis (ex Xue et al. 2023)]
MIPSYLKGYEELYAEDPHEAGLAWFRDAELGMSIHYGLYSLLCRGEWVMYHKKIHVAHYECLSDIFTAEYFNAEEIADLAVQSEMKYINFTTRHHDSFCLFETKETAFNSINSPAGRDFLKELAAACEKRGLGLFLYYSYGADWRHPYFLSNEVGIPWSRPPYRKTEPSYLYKEEKDFQHYIAFMHAQIRELLTNYGVIAGIWFDAIVPCYFRPDLFPVGETYNLVRSLQPQCLISFKQGVTGTEDFMSQEMQFVPLEVLLSKTGASQEAIDRSNEVLRKHKNKRNEVCTVMQKKGWGYVNYVKHICADEAMLRLRYAAEKNCNLLLNTGPYPDGTIPPEDVSVFKELGRRIRRHGTFQ